MISESNLSKAVAPAMVLQAASGAGVGGGHHLSVAHGKPHEPPKEPRLWALGAAGGLRKLKRNSSFCCCLSRLLPAGPSENEQKSRNEREATG